MRRFLRVEMWAAWHDSLGDPVSANAVQRPVDAAVIDWLEANVLQESIVAALDEGGRAVHEAGAGHAASDAD